MSAEKIDLSTVAQQKQQQQGPDSSDAAFVAPVSSVPLPSKGKIYADDSALHEADSIDIRAMTAKDEDILTSRALLKQGKAISALLRSCVVNKLVQVDEMVTGDRNAILIAVRTSGYGPAYETKVKCPKCDEEFEQMFDLNGLTIKQLGADPLAPGKNLFQFRLPTTGKDVLFKLLTGNDEQELSKTLERSRKAGQLVDNAMTLRLAASIESLGGETDRAKISKMVASLPALDSKKLRDYITKIEPGVNLEQMVTCKKCFEESEVDVPVYDVQFFWPN
jgi:hypothetical protein